MPDTSFLRRVALFDCLGDDELEALDKLAYRRAFAKGQLIILAEDPGETRDLSQSEPEKLVELLAGWDEYVKTTGVVVLDRDEGYGRK